MIADANHEVTKTNPNMPNRDNNCINSIVPNANFAGCMDPSNGPSIVNKKNNAVVMTGKTNVQRSPLLLNLGKINLSVIKGKK